MRVPEKYYDEIFDFKGQWDMSSRCGLKILLHEKPVVIVTELYQDNPGTSVTAAGKSLAEQICQNKGLNLNEIQYLHCNPDTNSKLSFYDEEFFEVDLKSNEPSYRKLSAEEILKLFK
ncbi:MAG: hypothetical protein FWD28_00830 [Treponema sp.]|nr:hypothetical protein [Treponema sp.]